MVAAKLGDDVIVCNTKWDVTDVTCSLRLSKKLKIDQRDLFTPLAERAKSCINSDITISTAYIL